MRTKLTLKEADRNHVKLLAEGIYGSQIDSDTKLEAFLTLISDDLSEAEAALLIYKHGLEAGSKALSLLEVSKEFGITREKARQVEQKAFMKLKHPHRRDKVIGDKVKLSTITLDTPIEECDLLTRTITILKKVNVKTVKEFLDLRLEDFFKSEELTAQVINDVYSFMRYINL